MAFDPLLYLAFGVGLLVGHLIRSPPAALRPATLAAVVVLVALLGASLYSVPIGLLAREVPIGLGLAAALVGLTGGAYVLIARRAPASAGVPSSAAGGVQFLTSGLLLGALAVGFASGRIVRLPVDSAIEWALYVLIALVAMSVRFDRASLRRSWVPLLAAGAGASVTAVLGVAIFRLSWSTALATTLGFGWYSLTGPLVAARAGAALGLVAFLANFLRENLTMVLAPVVGRRLGGEGLAAIGGATSMDTTLYFVTRYGGPQAGGLAITTGLALTVAASLLVPAALAI